MSETKDTVPAESSPETKSIERSVYGVIDWLVCITALLSAGLVSLHSSVARNAKRIGEEALQLQLGISMFPWFPAYLSLLALVIAMTCIVFALTRIFPRETMSRWNRLREKFWYSMLAVLAIATIWALVHGVLLHQRATEVLGFRP